MLVSYDNFLGDCGAWSRFFHGGEHILLQKVDRALLQRMTFRRCAFGRTRARAPSRKTEQGQAGVDTHTVNPCGGAAARASHTAPTLLGGKTRRLRFLDFSVVHVQTRIVCASLVQSCKSNQFRGCARRSLARRCKNIREISAMGGGRGGGR